MADWVFACIVLHIIIVFPLEQTKPLNSCLEFIEDDCIFLRGGHFHHDIRNIINSTSARARDC